MECVGTCIVVTVRVLLYRLICGVGCCGLLFYYLGACVLKFYECGAFIYGVVLVTVTTVFGLGLVCI